MKRGCINTALAALALACASAALAAGPAARPARAAPGAVVEAVQMPAWVERDGARIPLSPGMQLQQQDQLRTGAGSRLLLRTADGSAVKLGEKASLLIESVLMRRGNVFEAALKVGEGAFRFTTELLEKYRGRREVRITVANVTAGIRGTDVWGKAAADRDIVCLIEGKVEVQHGPDNPVVLDRPLSFYVAPKNKPPLVAAVSKEQLALWSAETDTQAGRGVARRGGKWNITAASSAALEAALGVSRKLREAGYAAEIFPARAKDRRIYNVRLSNFAGRQDALAVAMELKRSGRLGEYDPQVGR